LLVLSQVRFATAKAVEGVSTMVRFTIFASLFPSQGPTSWRTKAPLARSMELTVPA
jgi:hypothetical protein